MKKSHILIIALAAIVLITSFVIGGIFMYKTFGHYSKTSNDIEIYNNIAKEQTALPQIENLGDYKDIDAEYFCKNMGLYVSEAYTLLVTYDEQEYIKEKDRVLSKYSFETNVPKKYEEDPIKQAEFRVGDFDFKLLSFEKYNLSYPKEMIFIGTSEKTNQVVYIYFLDEELDYISADFETFLKEYCNWK